MKERYGKQSPAPPLPSNNIMATRFKRYLRRIGYVLPLLLLVMLILLTNRAPIIDYISPEVAHPGSTIEIVGRYFGQQRNGALVRIGGQEITRSYYLTWNDRNIVIQLPSDVLSGMLRVESGRGISNGVLLINATQTPGNTLADQLDKRPHILRHSPQQPSVGDLVRIEGERFGTRRISSEIHFRWQSAKGDPGIVAVPEEDYEDWSHRAILFRIPSGIIEGTLVVITEWGESNAYQIPLDWRGGARRYTHPLTIAIHYGAWINAIEGQGLYLWLPLPPENAHQHAIQSLYRNYEADYRIAGHIEGIWVDADDTPYTLEQSFLLRRYQIESELQQSRIPFRYEESVFLAPYLAPSPLIPADDPALQKIAGSLRREGHPLAVARRVYDRLLELFEPLTRARVPTAQATVSRSDLAIAEWDQVVDDINQMNSSSELQKRLSEIIAILPEPSIAHSYHYAIIGSALLRIQGIPARPVAGYLLLPSEGFSETTKIHQSLAIREHWRLVAHYWIECYLPKTGWVSLDIAMGDGLFGMPPTVLQYLVSKSDREEEEVQFTEQELRSALQEFYFGNLDPFRFTMNYGWQPIPQLVQGQVAKGQAGFTTFFSHQFEYPSALDSQEVSLYPVRLIGVSR